MPVRPERDLPPTAPEAAGTGNGALGKPPETAGRKAMGTKSHLDYVSPAADSISKPLETAGRKAMGAKVLKVLRQPGRRTLCIRVLAKKGLGRNMSKK